MESHVSPGYAFEKLSATVLILAEGRDRINDRLLNAYLSQGNRMGTIDGGPNDPGLGADMARLHERLTSQPAVGDEGTIAATIATLSEEDASKVAAELVQLLWRVVSVQDARR